MVQMLYEDSECAVLDEGEESEWFKVNTGVKQGDVMSGFIFLMVVDWIMRNTTAGNKTGIRWNFTSKLEDLDFADDIALMSSRYTHMQTKTRQLNQFGARTGRRINKKKTQVLRINSKCKNRILIIDDQELKEVDKYNYLGANVSKQGGSGDDIVKKIRKARVSFMKLKQILSSNIYSLRSKLRLFNTLVQPVLYGSETWKINEGDNRKIHFFKCLRRILQIRWLYIVSNQDILAKTKLKTISTEVKLRRWKWVGHILRMDKNSKCEKALTWTPGGRGKVG